MSETTDDILEDNADTNNDSLGILELSDEDFNKIIPPGTSTVGTVNETSTNQSEDSSTQALEIQEETEIDSGTESVESGTQGNHDNSFTPTDPVSTEGTQKDPKKESLDEAETGETQSTNTSVVDYESEYKRLMAPFKANGVNMQIQSVDDAIQLMQMGAGFHKKMAALKPAMRQMKLLEKNGLLDDTKLNYLIDLHNRNPEAIKNLLKESNLDPLDIDLKEDTKYIPTDRKISDTEIALDDVLNNIRETPTFHRTLNVISKEWDEVSQNAIANEPQIIQTINGHMQDGTFDAVMQRVGYERSMGRLIGVSDIHAYMQMGNTMADEGRLHRVGSTQKAMQSTPNIQPTTAEPSKQEIERKQKKRAASPTKVSKTTVATVLDPLDLSDEDFAKLDINKYIRKSS